MLYLLIEIFQSLATITRRNPQVISTVYKSPCGLTPDHSLNLISWHSSLCSLLTKHWQPCCPWWCQSIRCLRNCALVLPQPGRCTCVYAGFSALLPSGWRVTSWEKPSLIILFKISLLFLSRPSPYLIFLQSTQHYLIFSYIFIYLFAYTIFPRRI